MTTPRIPLNFFGIPFGLAGLAGTWLTMTDYHHAPVAVGNTILALSAVVWIILVLAYLPDAIAHRNRIGADMIDPIASPFISLVVITPIIWGAEGVFPHMATPGRVVVDIFVALTVVLGSWFTGQWIYRPLDFAKIHPGYFLPTVAGGLVASFCSASVGQQRLAEAMFGFGVISWLVVGSLILARLFFQPMLATPLIPTLAIEVAPAAVASLAYFAQHGDRIDSVAAFLAGYGVLMVLAQVRLLPAYLQLRFMPSFWALTFSWAAVATAAVHWLRDTHPAGHTTYEYIVLILISALVGAITIRTVIALARGQLIPSPVVPTAPDHSIEPITVRQP